MRTHFNRTPAINYEMARLSSLRQINDTLRNSKDAITKFQALQDLSDLNDASLEEKISKNDIRLGQTPPEEISLPNGTPVTIPSKRLNCNLTITSRIRGGKTYLMMLILVQLARLGIRWIIFDLKKSFRRLIDTASAILLTPTDLRHNLFKPPAGVPARPFLMRISSLFAGTQVLSNVSEHEFFSFIWGLLLEHQKLHPGTFPDIFMLLSRLDEYLQKVGYKEARIINLVVGLKHRVGGLCVYLGDVYDEGAGVEISNLCEKSNLIVDCSGYPTDIVAFFFLEILARLSLSRLFRGSNETNSPLLVVAADEFESIIAHVNLNGNSFLVEHWRQDRESNQGKMVTNHAADFHQRYDNQIITNTITTNSMFHIVGPMGNEQELKKVGQRLGFEDYHYEWLNGDVERRFVLACTDCEPVCFVADELNLGDRFNESEHERRKSFLLSQYPSDPVPPLRKEFGFSKIIFRKEFNPSQTMDEVRAKATSDARAKAIQFLHAHVQNSTLSYGELRGQFAGDATANRAKRVCLENGWLQEAAIPCAPSRPSLYFHLTSEGREVLEAEGLLGEQQNVHHIKHHTFVVTCIDILSRRLRESEFDLTYDQGDGLDLLVKNGRGLVLFELEFSYTMPVTRELIVVQRAIDSGVPRVIIVVLDFEEVKKNSFKMILPEGKLKAFRAELETNFEHINHVVELKTWNEILKWTPQQ